jgi:hypothetical protein
MKTKIAVHFGSLIVLIGLATGCCTSAVMKDFHRTTVDNFNPSSAYESTNSDGFALMSNRHDPPFAIIPESELLSHKIYLTNTNLLLEQIRRLPPELTKQVSLRQKLPANFEKVANLPRNNIYLDVREHHLGRAVIIFAPFALAVDILTAPIQLVMILSMSNSSWE